VKIGDQVIEVQREADDIQRQKLLALYEANFDAIYRFCLARTGDSAVADDATAEAFFAAARALAEDVGARVDRAWLFVVARNRIVDHWRQNERQRRKVSRLQNQRQRWTSGPADSHLADDTSERVLRALGSLPERQRAAVVLRYLDEFSVAEIATDMDIEYRAAESLLARGRRGFKKAWEKQ